MNCYTAFVCDQEYLDIPCLFREICTDTDLSALNHVQADDLCFCC